MRDDPDDLIRNYTVAFTVDGQTVAANEYDADQTLSETIKSAENHIKKLYDKTVVGPVSYTHLDVYKRQPVW